MELSQLRIEPIKRHHHRDQFDCGEPALDDYLKRYARQNDERNIAKCFVAVDTGNRVLGYYCLSAASVAFASAPASIKKRLPKYPIPAARIGQLAVDSLMQGRGVATYLLIDALQRILNAAHEIGVKVVLVDALTETAKGFYLHYGFLELPGHDFNLFLPIETIEQLPL